MRPGAASAAVAPCVSRRWIADTASATISARERSVIGERTGEAAAVVPASEEPDGHVAEAGQAIGFGGVGRQVKAPVAVERDRSDRRQRRRCGGLCLLRLHGRGKEYGEQPGADEKGA